MPRVRNSFCRIPRLTVVTHLHPDVAVWAHRRFLKLLFYFSEQKLEKGKKLTARASIIKN